MKHYNIVTGKGYEGQNQAELVVKANKEGFTSKKWGTFLQWKDQNRKIKKGQHGTSVFKGYGAFDGKNKKGDRVTESRPLGFAKIFNEDQLEELKNKENIKIRLEYLRGEIQVERISYSEIAELQSLARYIEQSDVLLLEWAGVAEGER